MSKTISESFHSSYAANSPPPPGLRGLPFLLIGLSVTTRERSGNHWALGGSGVLSMRNIYLGIRKFNTKHQTASCKLPGNNKVRSP